jgi:hypothetical protein
MYVARVCPIIYALLFCICYVIFILILVVRRDGAHGDTFKLLSYKWVMMRCIITDCVTCETVTAMPPSRARSQMIKRAIGNSVKMLFVNSADQKAFNLFWYFKLEVLRAVKIKALCDMTQCSLLHRYQRFGGIYGFHLQDITPNLIKKKCDLLFLNCSTH